MPKIGSWVGFPMLKSEVHAYTHDPSMDTDLFKLELLALQT